MEEIFEKVAQTFGEGAASARSDLRTIALAIAAANKDGK